MANTYEQIMAMLKDAQGKAKNMMGLSNTITRDNGIPLDYSSVQKDLATAIEYAKSATAYIGQPISVGDTLYVVTDEAGGYLKAVGTKPSGDDKSITVDENGIIAIKGFEAAADATLPQKNADGTINWVPINAIVSGDGNTKAVVTAADDSDITVTSSYSSETDTYTYTLDVTLPAVPEYSISKEVAANKTVYKLTKDGTAVGEVIEVPEAYDDSTLNSRVAAVEETVGEHESRLDEIELFFKDAAKDAGEGESLQEALDTLVEIQNYITNDGLAANEMLSAIEANTLALEELNGEGENSVSGKIAAQALVDASNYATKDALAAVEETATAAAVKSEVETALAEKVDNTTLTTNYYTKLDTYSKEEINDLLDEVTGGTNETAASVRRDFEAHTAAAAANFEAIGQKDTEQDTAIQNNADAIAEINNTETGIYAKAVAAAASDTQSKIEALVEGQIGTNASDIASIKNNIININNSVSTFTEQIETLGQKDTSLEASLNLLSESQEALDSTVESHATSLQDLSTRTEEVEAQVSANTANFENYSTTAQVEDKIDEKIAAISYKELEESIATNAEAINEETLRAQEEESRLETLVEQATNKADTNASNIASLEATLNAVIDNEDNTALDSIKELAAWVAEHDGAGGVLEQVNKNKTDIAVLNGEDTVAGSVKKTVKDAIEAIPVATGLEAGLVKASDEISVSGTGVMNIISVSTDKLVQGSNTLVLNGGSASATITL